MNERREAEILLAQAFERACGILTCDQAQEVCTDARLTMAREQADIPLSHVPESARQAERRHNKRMRTPLHGGRK